MQKWGQCPLSFSRFKVGIINPEVAAIGHRDTGRIPFHFAAELVRRLKPNRTRTLDGILHQPNYSLLLEFSLGAPVLPNRREKTLQLAARERRAIRDACQCQDEKNRQ